MILEESGDNLSKIIDVKVINDFNRPLKIIGDELFKKINKFL